MIIENYAQFNQKTRFSNSSTYETFTVQLKSVLESCENLKDGLMTKLEQDFGVSSEHTAVARKALTMIEAFMKRHPRLPNCDQSMKLF